MSKGAAAAFTERFGRGSGIYLVDFAVFKPPDEWLMTRKALADAITKSKLYTEESVEVMRKIAYGEAMGMGETTPLVHLKNRTNFLNMTAENPVDKSVEACIEESEAVMYPTIDAALRNAGMKPSEVDYVLTTNSTFNPVPSLSARVCNYFKMRSDCINYSLSGHGCPSGILLIDMAKHILKANPNKVVLLVAQESILPYFYGGNKKEFLFSNVLFRSGGAAILISNRKKDARRSKYELVASVRVLKADNDEFHNCIKMREDEEGRRGVLMQTRMVKKAAEAASRTALTRIAPRILPVSELVKAARDKNYVPDFTKGIHHLALHTAAKFVVQGVAESLRFPPEACQPCVESLFRFGNTSCASTYYVLANLESRRGIKRGERVLQMGMGSGFKCVISVWQARRHVYTRHPAWDDNPLYDVPSSWTDDTTLGDANDSVAQLHAANSDMEPALEFGTTPKSIPAVLPATKVSDGFEPEKRQIQQSGGLGKETPSPFPEPPALAANVGLASAPPAVVRGLTPAIAKPVNFVAAPSSVSVAEDGPTKVDRSGSPVGVLHSLMPTPLSPATPQISPVVPRAISNLANVFTAPAPPAHNPITVRGILDNITPRTTDEDTAAEARLATLKPPTSSLRKHEAPATASVVAQVTGVRTGAEADAEENIPLVKKGFRGTAISTPALPHSRTNQVVELHPAKTLNQHHQQFPHLPAQPSEGLLCNVSAATASPESVGSPVPNASTPAADGSQPSTTVFGGTYDSLTVHRGTGILSSAPECTASSTYAAVPMGTVADRNVLLGPRAQSESPPPQFPVTSEAPASANSVQPAALGLQDHSLKKANENGDLIRGATASLYARIENPATSSLSVVKHVVIPPSAKEKFRNAKARFEQVARASQIHPDDGSRPRVK
eukprot:jgi/Botrbrau1/22659/Bobra.0132s0005.1